MNKRSSHRIEQELVTSAAEALDLARSRGTVGKVGIDAVLATLDASTSHKPTDIERLLMSDSEAAAYFQHLGSAVDQIVALKTVDQQR